MLIRTRKKSAFGLFSTIDIVSFLFVLDLATYSYITNNEHDVDDGHSKTCFFEHQIKDWFSEKITLDQSTYSKLQRNKESDKLDTLELPEGLFLLNGVKVWNEIYRHMKIKSLRSILSFSIKNVFYDKMDLRFFYFHVTI